MKVNRKSTRVMQIIVAVTALALVFTAIPAVLFGSGEPPVAAAANLSSLTYNGPDTEAASEIKLVNSQLKSLVDGVELTLNTDLIVPADSGHFALQYDASGYRQVFQVPENKTFIIHLNGHSIRWERTYGELKAYNNESNQAFAIWEDDDVARLGGMHYTLIDNAGTLVVSGNGSLSIDLQEEHITGGNEASKTDDKWMGHYFSTAVIANAGTVQIGGGVIIKNNTRAGADGNLATGNGLTTDFYITVNGIYQSSGTVTFAGTMDIDAWCLGSVWCRSYGAIGNEQCRAAAYAYGIYVKRGSVNTVGENGKASIDVKVDGGIASNHPNKMNQHNFFEFFACGIYSAGPTNIDRTQIKTAVTYDIGYGGSDKNGMRQGRPGNLCGTVGVLCKNVNPVLTSTVDITVGELGGFNTGTQGQSAQTQVYGSVCKISEHPMNQYTASDSGAAASGSVAWNAHQQEKAGQSNGSVPPEKTSGTAYYFQQNSTYLDENGNTYSGDLYLNKNKSTVGSDAAKNLVGGLPKSQASNNSKVIVLYRFYRNNTQLENIYDSANNLVSEIKLQNVSKATVASGTSIAYESGGIPRNPNFCALKSLTVDKYGKSTDVGANFSRSSVVMSVLAEPNEDGSAWRSPANSPVTAQADSTSTTVVFADYNLISPADLAVSVNNSFVFQNSQLSSPTTPSVEIEYTGQPITMNGDLSNSIPFRIARDGRRYSLSDDDRTKFSKCDDLTESFGAPVGNGAHPLSLSVVRDGETQTSNVMPTDVGSYRVTLTVPDETEYREDPNEARNFEGASFAFDLTIKPRGVRIVQDKPVPIEYGQKIGSLTQETLRDCFRVVANGLDGEDVDLEQLGVYSWVNAADAVFEVPEPGQENPMAQIRWDVMVGKNYSYGVLDNAQIQPIRKSVMLTPQAKTIAYGVSMTLSVDEIVFSGVLEQDRETVRQTVIDSLVVEKLPGSNVFEPYVADGSFNAGIYQYKFAQTQTRNYTIICAANTLTVSQRALSMVIPHQTKLYDGLSVITLAVENSFVQGLLPTTTFGSADGIVIEPVEAVLNLPDAGERTATLPAGSIRMSGAKAENYVFGELTYSFGVTVERAPSRVDTLTLTDATVTYDPMKTLSKFHELNENVVTGVIKTVAGDGTHTAGEWVWKSDLKPTVNVRTYTAQFRPFDKNWAPVDQTVDIVVLPRPITVSVVMEPISYGDDSPTGVYRFEGFDPGSPEYIDAQPGQSPRAVGFSMQGGALYSVAYDPMDDNNNDVGDYPINIDWTYTAANYIFSTSAGVLRVDPRELTVTVPDVTVSYGTLPQDIRFEPIVSGFVHGEENLSVEFRTDVGGYTQYLGAGNRAVASLTPVGLNTNYKTGDITASIIVEKAIIDVYADDITVQYGTPLQNVVYAYHYSGLKNDEGPEAVIGEPLFSSAYSATAEAGQTLAITVSVNNMSAENYYFRASDVTGYVTVDHAAIRVAAPVYTVHNGLSLADAVVAQTGEAYGEGDADTPVDGLFRIVNPEQTPDYNGGQEQAIQVVFVPSNRNYRSWSGVAKLTVLPNEIGGNLAIRGGLLVGETLIADLGGLTPSNPDKYDATRVHWTLTKDGAEPITVPGWTLRLTADYVGCAVELSVEADVTQGYTGGRSCRAASRVIAANGKTVPTLEQLLLSGEKDKTVQYNGQPHRYAVGKGDPAIGEITVFYNGSVAAPTNAGVYQITVDISDSIAGTYGPVVGLPVGTLTVEPKPIMVSFDARDKEYDGRTAAVVSNIECDGQLGFDDVQVVTDYAEFAFENADAGARRVVMSYAYLTGAARANYVIRQYECVAEITQKEISAYATAAAQDYQPGQTTVKQITFSGVSGILSQDRNGVHVNGTTGIMGSDAAGNNRVTRIDYAGVLTGDRAANYSFKAENESRLLVTVNRVADPDLVLPNRIVGKVYSALQTLDDFSAELPMNWAWVNPRTVPTVRVTTYRVRYTPENSNYLTQEFDLPVQILPKTVFIYPEPQTVQYGNPVPNYTCRIEGFTGSDSIASGGGSLLLSSNYYEGAGVGAYTITSAASNLSNPNYTFDKSATAVLSVTAREFKVRPYVPQRLVYDPDLETLTVCFEVSGVYVKPDGTPDDVRLTTAEVPGRLSSINAGSRRVDFEIPELTGAQAGNYVKNVSPKTLSVTIEKADPVVSWPTAATVPFGQRYSQAVFIGGSGDGRFEFVNVSGIADVFGTERLEARFIPSDSANYNTLTGIVPLTVVTAELDISASISGTLTEGQTLTAVVAGAPAEAFDCLRYVWYRVDEAGQEIHLNDTPSYQLTEDDVGYWIKLVVYTESGAPYSGSAEYVTTRAVEEVRLTFWQRLMKWWYAILAAIQSLFDVSGKI